MRKLATIQTIDKVVPIPNADKIEAVIIKGWQAVVSKGSFQPGDPCVFFEIDSWIPVEDRYNFLPNQLLKKLPGTDTYGYVIKTAKLRKTLSQGLVMELDKFPELPYAAPGVDVSGELGVHKYEPIDLNILRGDEARPWPAWIPKTDEERLQNIPEILDVIDSNWVVTEKIDGSSMTAFIENDEFFVASRNRVLKESDDNLFWKTARVWKIEELLRDNGLSAVQGEMFGPKIQGNPLNRLHSEFAAFQVYDDQEQLGFMSWPDDVVDIAVPALNIDPEKLATVEKSLDIVDGLMSWFNPERHAEGVVVRHPHKTSLELNGLVVKSSFKIISPTYIM